MRVAAEAGGACEPAAGTDADGGDGQSASDGAVEYGRSGCDAGPAGCESIARPSALLHRVSRERQRRRKGWIVASQPPAEVPRRLALRPNWHGSHTLIRERGSALRPHRFVLKACKLAEILLASPMLVDRMLARLLPSLRAVIARAQMTQHHFALLRWPLLGLQCYINSLQSFKSSLLSPDSAVSPPCCSASFSGSSRCRYSSAADPVRLDILR